MSEETTIETVEMFTAVKAKKHIILNHKIVNSSKDWIYGKESELNVSRKSAKVQKSVKYGVAYTGGLSDYLWNTYDKRVYNAVVSLYAAGNEVLTPSMIYRHMNSLDGRQGVSDSSIELIINSVDKSRETYIGIEFENDDSALKGTLIHADKVNVITGKYSVVGYQLKEKPILYQINTKQIITVDAGLLNTKDRIKRDSVNAVILKEFLIKRIENIKAGKLNPHIRFEAIYEELGISQPTRKNIETIRKNTENILLSLSDKKYIQKYDLYKQGKAFKGIKITTRQS